MDSDHDDQYESQEEVATRPKPQKKLKKNEVEEADADSDSQGEEDDDDKIVPLKKKSKTKKVYMANAISEVLSKTTKDENPILADFKLPFKKIKKELKERKEANEKRKIQLAKKNQGHYIPRYELDREKELQLKGIAIKGVVKLLNIVQEFQKNHKKQEAA